MCTDLHNTYKDEFTRIYLPQEVGLGLDELPEEVGLGLDELPEEVGLGLDEFPKEAGLGLDELPEEAGLNLDELPEEAGLNLNELPEEAALGLIELPQEVGLNLNELPQEAGLNLNELPHEAGLGLNELPQEAGLGLNEIPQEAGLNLNELPKEEDALDLDALEEEEDALEEGVGPKLELTNEQRFGVYFALEVIKCRDGSIQIHDKELIAVMLNTCVRTIERIWFKALGQIARNEEVDVSNKKKGNVGRKKKDLDLPSVVTVPPNRRRTIRGLARSLGVSRSTLHRRFKLGFLRRHSSRLKPSMTLANKLKRLQFCVSMLDQG